MYVYYYYTEMYNHVMSPGSVPRIRILHISLVVVVLVFVLQLLRLLIEVSGVQVAVKMRSVRWR